MCAEEPRTKNKIVLFMNVSFYVPFYCTNIRSVMQLQTCTTEKKMYISERYPIKMVPRIGGGGVMANILPPVNLEMKRIEKLRKKLDTEKTNEMKINRSHFHYRNLYILN